jgi:aldehyde dehydrogenase (NAD+)
MTTKTTAAVNIPDVVAKLREAFDSGRTRPIAWRRRQLQRLGDMLDDNEERLLEALAKDLGKPKVEAYAGEVGYLKGDVKHSLKHLRNWMKPERVKTPIMNFKGTSEIQREPLGVVLIIGPWNYPIQLLLAPLVGAISAGNCAFIKPSEVASHSAALMSELIPKYLDPDCVKVVQGGIPETTEILAQRFDHIFFTGSTFVGRIVMQAAAKHLTPVTLELGGKSPAIVDRNVDLAVAARRIAWGKFFNAGQTCVAPDYVLVHRSQEQPLLDALKRTVAEFYGPDPKASPDFGRIITKTHHERLVGFLKDGEPVCGGDNDPEERYLAPTVLKGVKPDAPIMAEEIFGPVLPVLPVDGIDEAIRFVNARPKPLALYVFTSDDSTARDVLSRTSSGGACVNDAVSHLVPPDLPFGGVGESGIGAYHGRHSFETFSHRKSVFKRATWIDPSLRYPPYRGAMKMIKKLMG